MKDLFLKLPNINIKTGLLVLLFSGVVLYLGTSLKPHLHYATTNDRFEQTIPRAFGDWMEVQQSTPQVSVVSDERSLINELYDDTLMRTYVDKNGQQIMLALAYAREQRQDVKVHQPEVCYPAQGYQMLKSEVVTFKTIKADSPIIGKRQLYSGQNHTEAVSYWIRVGDETMTSGLQMRFKIIKDGLLKNRLDDGILVRVSTLVSDSSQLNTSYQIHEKFLRELNQAVQATSPKVLVP